ncbi:MAG: S-layer homology domain-containing protein, partial [Clostridia bacterium]|nr:S-layer homology domain-containing protein [Clostridia bacterium]
MQTLSALGIMEGINGDLMPEKILTRAELVTLLARVMNMEYSSGKMYFEDVPADHWAQGAISAAYERGIINGVDSTHFAPDSPVTIEQAVKMIVTALGYGGQAVRKGGYPIGYVSIAQKIDLLDKVGASNGLILRRNAAAQLFYNALHLELPLLESISSDDAEFVTRDGVTLLSENLKIRKGEGIVNANDVTTLALSGGVADGCVQIGNMVFKEGNTNASDYIGYRVTYYANIAEGNEPYELLYVTIDEDRNEVLTVLAEDILDSTTETKLCYTENNKQRTEAISIYADLLYNGVSIGGFTKTDITSAKDFVTFIDNNGDNQFDVIRVFDPKTIVVGAVNTTTFGVYDRDNATDFTLLDPDEDDYTFTIYENGVKTDFSAIKVGSVVSVGESKNISGRKNKTVLISNASKEGIISAVGDNSVLIDDEEYKASSAIITTLKKYLGKSINVSIDAMGRAIRADEKAIDLFSYGYLITWGKDKGISNKI